MGARRAGGHHTCVWGCAGCSLHVRGIQTKLSHVVNVVFIGRQREIVRVYYCSTYLNTITKLFAWGEGDS
jgi:hypothetical protein